MGLLSWFKRKPTVDERVMAENVPELAGMDDVEGMAYVLTQIDEWNKTATPDRAAELAGRLIASQEGFKTEGSVMPYWANVWILRTYQAELGIPAPWVKPKEEWGV